MKKAETKKAEPLVPEPSPGLWSVYTTLPMLSVSTAEDGEEENEKEVEKAVQTGQDTRKEVTKEAKEVKTEAKEVKTAAKDKKDKKEKKHANPAPSTSASPAPVVTARSTTSNPRTTRFTSPARSSRRSGSFARIFGFFTGGADDTRGVRELPRAEQQQQQQPAKKQIGGATSSSSNFEIDVDSSVLSMPDSVNDWDLAVPVQEMGISQVATATGVRAVPLSSWYVFGVEVEMSAKAIVELKETNDKQSGFRLTDQQLSSLEQLMSSQPDSMQVDDVLLSALETGLGWSMDDIVPMLDLFRMGLLHEHVNRHYCDMKMRGSETRQRLIAIIMSAASDSVKVLACRCVANAFSHEWGRDMLAGEMGKTVPVVAACLLGQKPIMQEASASVMANWSLLMLKRSEKGVSELSPREDLVSVLIKVLENELSFGGRSEAALIKTLQAFITAMWGDAAVIRVAKSRNVVSIVNRLKDACVEETGKNIARDIIEMTFAV